MAARYLNLQKNKQIEKKTDLQEPSLKEKTAKGLFWGGLSNILQQIIGLVFGIIIARILSPDDYGLVAMLAIFTAVAASFIDSGFTVALVNKKYVRHEDYNAVFWFSTFMGIFIYLILFFSAPLIACFFNQPELIDLSRFIFLSILIASVGLTHYAILMKNIMARQLGIINICATLLSGVIGLLFALNGFAYWSLAIQQVSFMLLSVVLRWRFSHWRPTFSFNFTPIKEMFGFSSKMLATNLIIQIQGNSYNTLLGKSFNSTILGFYSQGAKWMNIVSQMINGMMNTVAQPVLVQANDNQKRQLRIFRKMTRLNAFIAFPILTGLAFIAPEFIRITLGDKWTDSIIYLQIMCGWGCISAFIVLYNQLLISNHKSDIILKGNILINSIQIGILILLFWMKFSAIFIVICYVATLWISFAYWFYYGKKLIGIKLIHLLKDIFPYIVVNTGAIALTVIILHNVSNIYILFVGKILLTSSIYLISLYFLDSQILKEIIYLFKYKTVLNN